MRSLRSRLWLACVVVALGGTACAELPAAPSGTAPFSQTDLRVGAGAPAVSGSNIVVNYTGWLYDEGKPEQKGLVFDTSAGLAAPFEFTLGVGQVIEGWDRGLVGLREGGLRRLVIPPSLSYGGFRNGIIPAHATLVFEVELVAVKTDDQ